MILTSFQFLVFMVVVLLLLLVLPPRAGKASPRKLALWTSSYAFCALIEWRSALLLFASTLVNHCAGRGLHRIQKASQRKLLLWAALGLNLGTLGFLKYYLFIRDSANFILSGWKFELPYLNLVLPLGISFYSFQAISYLVDIYRGKLEPSTSLIETGLLLAFFPKLVAGPLVRGRDFLGQLKKPIQIQAANVWAGSQTFIIGLFKKTMVADAVSPFVDAVFAHPAYYHSGTVWLAVVAYALQIYCDFSGYSDMAIGCARILGFRLGRNFDTPYLSRNIQDFWRRWHISLSNWLRDYLYIPLGGNRKGTLRTTLNLLITMTLGGLWHGASWNFVLWGSAHGLGLIVHRLWHNGTRSGGRAQNRASSILGTVATLILVTLAWVLFRAPDMTIAQAVYRKLLFVGSTGAAWANHAALAALGWTVPILFVDQHYTSQDRVPFKSPFSIAAALVVVATLLIIYLFAPTSAGPFIYVQF